MSSTAQFRLHFLGAMRVTTPNGLKVNFRSKRAFAVLAYLSSKRQPIQRDKIADLFWPGELKGRTRLRWHLTQTKEIVPEGLVAVNETLAFRVPDNWCVDTILIDDALQANDMGRLGALLLHTEGEFLAGYYDSKSADLELWLLNQREMWRRKLLQATRDLIHYYNSQGDYATATVFARKWLDIEPWEEAAHRWVMELLARQGQLSEALDQYRHCSSILATELGVEPEEATTNLFKRLQQTTNQPTHNLPSLPTFVGRDTELATLNKLFHDDKARVITIVGAGGMGKTHLATQAAHNAVNLFLDGIAFVQLAPLDRAASVPETVVSTLADVGIIPVHMGGQSPTRFLIQELRNKEVLIILDNVEHLIDSAASLMHIVGRVPTIKILVTSRARLQVRWEQTLELEGLPKDEAQRLFIEAARRHRASFSAENNKSSIKTICSLVEGMPLGIELAASWVRVQTCQKIADAIASNLDFLSSSERDRPDRHRSVRAAFNYSWELLTPEEQRMLSRLAVFQGGFSAEAAEEVAGATWGHLAPFIDKSLIRQQLAVAAEGANVRYQLHGLLRQFSIEKQAGNLEDVHALHAKYYTTMLNTHQRAIEKGVTNVLDEVERELSNIQQAWEWSVRTTTIQNLTLSFQALGFFTDARCRWQTALTLFHPAADQLLTLDDAPSVLLTRGGVLAVLGSTYGRLGKYDVAQGLLEEALLLFRNISFDTGITFTLFGIGRVLESNAKLDRAYTYYNESREHAESCMDAAGETRASVNLARLLLKLGDYSQALIMAERCLPRLEITGERREQVAALDSQSRCLYAMGQLSRALEAATACEAIATNINTAINIGEAKVLSGEILVALGDLDTAEQQLNKAIELLKEVGATRTVIRAWNVLVKIHFARDDTELAHTVAQRAVAVSQRNGFTEGELDARCQLAIQWLAQGRLLETQVELNRALSLSAELKRPPLQLRVLSLFAQLGVAAGQNTNPLYNLIFKHPATESHDRESVRGKATSFEELTLDKAMEQLLPHYIS